MEKIKSKLRSYDPRRMVNATKIIRDILPLARELCKNHPDYLRNLGCLGVYIRDIVNSSNPRSHGHFNEKRGRSYISGLFRELGVYD